MNKVYSKSSYVCCKPIAEVASLPSFSSVHICLHRVQVDEHLAVRNSSTLYFLAQFASATGPRPVERDSGWRPMPRAPLNARGNQFPDRHGRCPVRDMPPSANGHSS
jgi:hypothetical protein